MNPRECSEAEFGDDGVTQVEQGRWPQKHKEARVRFDRVGTALNKLTKPTINCHLSRLGVVPWTNYLQLLPAAGCPTALSRRSPSMDLRVPGDVAETMTLRPFAGDMVANGHRTGHGSDLNVNQLVVLLEPGTVQ